VSPFLSRLACVIEQLGAAERVGEVGGSRSRRPGSRNSTRTSSMGARPHLHVPSGVGILQRARRRLPRHLDGDDAAPPRWGDPLTAGSSRPLRDEASACLDCFGHPGQPRSRAWYRRGRSVPRLALGRNRSPERCRSGLPGRSLPGSRRRVQPSRVWPTASGTGGEMSRAPSSSRQPRRQSAASTPRQPRRSCAASSRGAAARKRSRAPPDRSRPWRSRSGSRPARGA